MRGFRQVVLVIAALALVSIVLVFTLENQQSISLLFLGWGTPELPVSVFIIIALLVGLLIGPVLMCALNLRRRWRAGRSV